VRRSCDDRQVDEDRGRELEADAVAQYLDGRYHAAAELYERAFTLYRRERDWMGAGRAARSIAWIFGNVLGDWAVRSGWLARARAALAEAGTDGPERGWVLIVTAWTEPDPVVREALLREAIAVGSRLADPDIEFLARGYLGGLFVLTDRVEEGMALSDEAMSAVCSGELSDLTTVDELFCGLFWACEYVNDVPRADQWIRAAAPRMGQSNVVAAFCRAHYGGILTSAGRWTEAERELVKAVRHFDDGMSPRRAAAVIRLADLRIRQGRLEEADELLTGLDRHPDAVRTLAALRLARGEPELARELLERATSTGDDDVPTVGESITVGPLLSLLVEVYLDLQDLDRARRTADRLAVLAAAQRGPYLRAAAALAAARVGIASDQGDAAIADLHRALDGFAVAQLPMELAQTRLELAVALAERSPEVAVAEARRALESFEELSAARSADAAGAVLRSLGAPIRTGQKGTGTLTRREAEILDLLGAGLSNREIAERLFITRKTVEHHVGNVLAKLSLRNRAQAAAYAARVQSRRQEASR
jgi:DNA-binding NarL/FixJ family response regulator